MSRSPEKSTLILAGVAVAASASVVAAYALSRRQAQPPTSGKYPAESLPAGAYDAIIVGAGPSGSSTAFYAATGGARVVLLDKESFPRDKYCGDAVCTPAIRILEEMGVLKELNDAGETHFADAGGFVSPHGHCYIGERMGWGP